MSRRATISNTLQLSVALFLISAAAVAVYAATQSSSDPVPTRSTRSARPMTPATGFEEKLSQIRANQDAIRALLKEVLVELGYAKTRATIR